MAEIATLCGPAFLYSDKEPYIYTDLEEVKEDILDEHKGFIVEVYLQPDGSLYTEGLSWEEILHILELNGYLERDVRELVQSKQKKYATCSPLCSTSQLAAMPLWVCISLTFLALYPDVLS